MFDLLFDGRIWPTTTERIGIMSIDSLDRLWYPVFEKNGHLIATSKDGKAAVLGRMCKRDDGKFCIEAIVRAAIEGNELRHYEFWHVDAADQSRHVRLLRENWRRCS